MVLLTSAQVSMALSSSIVLIFTFALFIAGIFLQQQTVKNLQVAIRPRHSQVKVTKHFIAQPRVEVINATPNDYVLREDKKRREEVRMEVERRSEPAEDWHASDEKRGWGEDDGGRPTLVDET